MSIDFQDIVRLIFKRKRVLLFAILLILGPAIVIALTRPTVYRARARIMITQARAYPQLSPQPEQKRTVPITDARLMEATVQTLKARTFLREVGAALASQGLEIPDAPPPGAEDAPNPTARNTRHERSWARRVAKRLEVAAPGSSPLIEVAFRSEQPEAAAQVVNTVVDTFIGYQARTMFDNPALRTFYETRRVELEADLIEAEHSLTEFQEKHQIYALEPQRAQLTRANNEAIDALRLNAGQIRQAEAEAKALVAHLQKLPAQVTLHTYGESPEVNALSAQIVNLELDLNNLRQLYTDADRRVIDARQRLAQARNMLMFNEEAAAQQPTATRLESNDAYQNILENSLRQQAAAEALRARRVEITKTVAESEQRLREFNRLSYEYERRRAERDAKQASYANFLTLLEQTRSSEAMDQEGLTNVRIIDHASVPSKPVPRRTWLTLAMGLIASFTVGVGGAFGLEAMSGTAHGGDVEQRLALPVLAVIREDA